MEKWAEVMKIQTSTTGNKGFTLIELLIVLLIIGVITSIATLSINTVRPTPTQVLYAQFQNQLELAQKTAQLKNIHLQLILKPKISTVIQLDPITQQWYKNNEIPALQWQNITVQSSKPEISILPNGFTTPATLSFTLGSESYLLDIK